jgi:hypothetical protein
MLSASFHCNFVILSLRSTLKMFINQFHRRKSWRILSTSPFGFFLLLSARDEKVGHASLSSVESSSLVAAAAVVCIVSPSFYFFSSF